MQEQLAALGLPMLDDDAVFLGIIEGLPNPSNSLVQALYAPQSTDATVIEWESEDATRELTNAVGPRDKALEKGKGTSNKYTASLAFFREKIVRSAFDVKAVQQAQTQRSRDRLTRRFTQDVQNIRNGIVATLDFWRWKAMTGSYTITYQDKPDVAVNTRIPTSNLITSGSTNGTQANADILTPLESFVESIERYGGSGVTCFGTRVALDYIFANTKVNSLIKANPALSAQYLRDGILMDPLRGITFKRIPGGEFYTVNGAPTAYVSDTELFFVATNEPVGLDFQGPAPDLAVDDGARGWYGKNFDDDEPSGRTQIIGYVGNPVIRYPRRLVYVQNIAAFDAIS